MAFDTLKAREALARRAAEIAGRETRQAGRPIGWNPAYDYDHWQRGEAELAAEQTAAQQAQAGQVTDWKANMQSWRESAYRQQFDQNGEFATQVLGPNGEELPYGARGWDPHGRADYGEGFQGWVKSLWYKLTAPMGDTGADTVAMKGEIPERATGYERAQGGIEGRKPDIGQTWENVKSGEAGKPLGYLSRGVSAVIGSALTAAGDVSKKTEQAVSARAAQEQAASDSPLPSVKDMPQWLEYFMKGTGTFNAYQDVRLWASPKFRDTLTTERRPGAIPFIEQGSEIDVAWQAGRIAYSAVVDPVVRHEYARRYLAGENPRLLAMELENPVAEMVGQMVYDPLNVIGIGGKSLREAKRVGSARQLFYDLPEDVGVALNALENVAGDARAAEGFQTLVAAVRTANQKTATGMDDFAKAYGLSALTANGKKHVVGLHTGDIARWIAAESRDDPEQAIEAYRALMMMASSNEDEVATGIAFARNFSSPQPLFSRAAREAGVVLKRTIGDDPKGFLKGLQKAQDEGVDGVIAFMDKKLTGAIDGMFPTLTERIEAGEKLPWATRAIVRFDRGMQKGLYRPLNTFFAGVYMGLSPGYVVRNLISGMEHILIDEGIGAFKAGLPGVFRGTASWWDENTKGWIGFMPKSAGGFGTGTAGVDVIKRFGLSNWAEKSEAWQASAVIGHSVEQSMRRMLKRGRALPDGRELLDAGLSEGSVRQLEQLIVRNKGDVRAAVKAFKQAATDGNIDAFRTMSWLATGDEDALRGFGLYDELAQAWEKAATQDEAVAALRAVQDRLNAGAAKVADDIPAVASDAIGVDDVQSLGEAHAVGEASQSVVRNATHYTQANHISMMAFDNALSELRKMTPDWPGWSQLGDSLDSRIATGTVAATHEARKSNVIGYRNASFSKNFSIAQAWKEIGGQGPPPQTADKLRRYLWEEYYFPFVRESWEKFREDYAQAIEKIFTELGQDTPLLAQARKDLEAARKFDDFLRTDQVIKQLAAATDAGDNATAARILANKYRIATKATDTGTGGANLDQRLLNMINANLEDGVAKFDKLADVPPDVAEAALLKHSLGEGGTAPAAAAAAPPPPPYAGNTPSGARVIEQQSAGLAEMFKRLEQGIQDNWGRKEPAFTNRQIEGALSKYAKVAIRQVGEARLLAAGVGDEARKFTLLSYPEKTGLDMALAYIFPYQFWYNRTYQNWMRRIAYNPEVVAGYAKYKDALAKLHAGAPEWWKYNINTNELLGIDSENPWYFNLEASLVPVHGLTGVDFDDINRRPEWKYKWWTDTMDAIGRFGPSTWTPISLATAVLLHVNGEEDAAARWAGRLIPQTAALKSAMTLMGAKVRIGKGLNDLDLLNYFFSNGLDPYEQRRVGRALGQMVNEGTVDPAAALDASYHKDSDLWYEAVDRAIAARAPGQLASFFLGVGFKARNQSDISIDQFYTDYGKLWAMKPLLSPVEFRNSMDNLHAKYPFMDVLLLSRKAGSDRDSAYAYTVIGRIPPGQSDDLYELVGVDKRLVSKFYETKGELEKWPKADREQFMTGTVQLGALLAVPDDATRAEWSRAWGMKKQVEAETERLFGKDIREKIGVYYDLPDMDAKNEYKANNPDVRDAMSFEESQIANNSFLAAYYGGISKIESYYEGLMYAAIRGQLGQDIHKKWGEYWTFKDAGDDKGARAYWKKHPELGKYLDMKDRELAIIAKRVVEMERLLPETKPAMLRRDADLSSLGAQDLAAGMQPQQTVFDFTWSDWQAIIPEPLGNIMKDKVYGGKKLPSSADKMIERLAGELDISEALLQELLERSLYEAR